MRRRGKCTRSLREQLYSWLSGSLYPAPSLTRSLSLSLTYTHIVSPAHPHIHIQYSLSLCPTHRAMACSHRFSITVFYAIPLLSTLSLCKAATPSFSLYPCATISFENYYTFGINLVSYQLSCHSLFDSFFF